MYNTLLANLIIVKWKIIRITLLSDMDMSSQSRPEGLRATTSEATIEKREQCIAGNRTIDNHCEYN